MTHPASGIGKLVLGFLVAVCLVGFSPSEQALLDAAQRGDIEAVRTLLAEGVAVDAAFGDGMTALHLAAERGDADLVELLVSAGASVSARVRIGGYTPLHIASRSGSSRAVELLLEAGADPADLTTNSGASALHMAASAGNPRSVELLVAAGADVNAREGAWQQTPLVFAAANNRVEAVSTLLRLGADPSLASRAIDVPERARRDQAATRFFRDHFRELRETHGAGDPLWQPTPQQVQEAIAESRRLLRGEGGEEEGVAAGGMEEADEDRIARYPDLVGRWGGLTPLLHAVRQGHVESVHALLDGGADINHVAEDGDGTSALLMATINGHFDLAVDLLSRGADPNRTSDAGTSPLHGVLERQWAPRSSYAHPIDHQAQRTSYLELLEALLEAGADPNQRLTMHLWYMQYTFDVLRINMTGATPFWRAAYATDLEAMRLLVSYGADPHLATQRVPSPRRGGMGSEPEDHSGLPPVPVGAPAVHPIHAASGVGFGEGWAANAHRHVPGGWLPAIRYLVEELGADVNQRDHNGYTALHHAASRGDDQLIRYLVEQGADVTVVSRRGQTTVDMANGPAQRIQPYPSTIQLLESLGAHNNNNCVSC
jgi:uncharacterized protein